MKKCLVISLDNGSQIEESYLEAKKVTRYAIKKDTRFDKVILRNMLAKLPVGYEMKEIGGGFGTIRVSNGRGDCPKIGINIRNGKREVHYESRL